MGLQKLLDKIQIFYDKFDHGQGQYSKERVAARAEYHALMRKTDFMSVEEYKNFNSAYAGKNLKQFIRYAPKPELDGYYKVKLLGKIHHPTFETDIFLPTGIYSIYQLKCTKNFSTSAIGGLSVDFSIVGLIFAILATIGFVCLGIALRLPFAILLVVIHVLAKTFTSPKKG